MILLSFARGRIAMVGFLWGDRVLEVGFPVGFPAALEKVQRSTLEAQLGWRAPWWPIKAQSICAAST